MATPKSIRQIIRQGLLNGLTTSQIGEELKLHHPDSAAAEKVSKHVGFYRCQMVKAGEIAKGTGVEPQATRSGSSSKPQTSKVEDLEKQVAEMKMMLAAMLERGGNQQA